MCPGEKDMAAHCCNRYAFRQGALNRIELRTPRWNVRFQGGRAERRSPFGVPVLRAMRRNDYETGKETLA